MFLIPTGHNSFVNAEKIIDICFCEKGVIGVLRESSVDSKIVVSKSHAGIFINNLQAINSNHAMDIEQAYKDFI